MAQNRNQTPEWQFVRMATGGGMSRSSIFKIELRIIRALTAAYALFLLAEILAAAVGWL